jgi:hypothetical protein
MERFFLNSKINPVQVNNLEELVNADIENN